MDILGWLASIAWWLLGALWSLVWLLIGGWVSTLLQILALLLAFYVYRYGWRAAPAELWRQALALGRFATGAMRASEAMAAAEQDRREERRRSGLPAAARAARHRGDVTINLSTTLSAAMLGGLLLVWLAG